MEQIIANRYRLEMRIGHGAMGEVWRARDTTLDRDVAVKIVNLYAPTDPSAAARFRREATATAGLSHPNVVRVFDAGFDDPREAFMVMELLSGPSLGELVGTIGWQEAVELTAQVAAGLAAAHQVGVIHRDVKPNNVMLDGGGNRRAVKVVDFGIARLAQSGDATLTAPATALGTAAYMSPEQAAGSALSPATDIYSLGCLLFALLTGKPPFVGDSPLAVLQQHVFQTPPLPSERNHAVPESVDALVAQMMQRRPEDRPDVPSLTAMTRAVLAQAGGAGEGTRADALPTMPMVVPGDDSAARAFAAVADPESTAAYPRSQRTPNAPTDQPASWSKTVTQQGGPPRGATASSNRTARRRSPVGLIVAIVILAILVVGGILLLNGLTSGMPEKSATPTTSEEASTTEPSREPSEPPPANDPEPQPKPPAPAPPAPETSAAAPTEPPDTEPTGSAPDEPEPTGEGT